MNNTTKRIYKNRKGFALFMAIYCVFLLMLLGTALVFVSTLALNQTKHNKNEILAFNLAESGAEKAVRWLKEQPYPPTNVSPFDPFNGEVLLSEGKYQVTIIPDANNWNSALKTFTVVSKGTIYGHEETIEQIVRQQSFGKYAYFTDREVSSVTGGKIWFFSGDKIRGPAHSNSKNGSDFQINWQGSQQAIFEDMLTSASSSITYSPREPNTEEEYLKIYKTGSRGYQLGVDPIELPSSTTLQRDAAWGASSGFPSANGVYVPENGGIYIKGNASITLQTDAIGRQRFRIQQGGSVIHVTIDREANYRMVVNNDGTPYYVPGAGTGVVYSADHITSLSGVIADNILTSDNPPQVKYRSEFTIATDVNNGKNITITSDITYKSTPDPNAPLNDIVNLKPGTLGLIGRNIVVANTAPKNLEINAVMLAGGSTTSDGSFYVSNYNTKTPTGVLKILGGIIQKARGPVGTFNPVTGKIVTGYAKDYWYDPRLANNPPPYFPTTGLYDRISWKRTTTDN